MQGWIILAAAIAALLQIGDAATTVAALRLPGTRERNRLVRWLIERLGLVGGVAAAKLVAATALVLLLLLPTGAGEGALLAALALLCVFYGWVVAHNLRVIARRRAAALAGMVAEEGLEPPTRGL